MNDTYQLQTRCRCWSQRYTRSYIQYRYTPYMIIDIENVIIIERKKRESPSLSLSLSISLFSHFSSHSHAFYSICVRLCVVVTRSNEDIVWRYALNFHQSVYAFDTIQRNQPLYSTNYICKHTYIQKPFVFVSYKNFLYDLISYYLTKSTTSNRIKNIEPRVFILNLTIMKTIKMFKNILTTDRPVCVFIFPHSINLPEPNSHV